MKQHMNLQYYRLITLKILSQGLTIVQQHGNGKWTQSSTHNLLQKMNEYFPFKSNKYYDSLALDQ
jgi:hypothetical protein